MIKRLISNILPPGMKGRYLRTKELKRWSDRFDTAIKLFLVNKGITDENVIRRYRKKLESVFIKDNWYPEEYFYFNYEHLSQKGVKEFVPWREASRFWNWMNTKDVYDFTCDKCETYRVFNEFYKRDLVSVSPNKESIEKFKIFIEKHPKFIAKPTFGNYGNGCKIVDSAIWRNIEQETQSLLKEYEKGFVAEELIEQCKELAEFHPSSVNTVRLTTARQSNGEIYIIKRPFIRIGQGGRCVDNGGNGGIICSIDYETGIINGAIDESLNRYILHPNTGKTILGFQIPHWEELKQLVVKVANVMPELKYCGWDFALTDKGWVMVEANGKGLFIGLQMPTQEGMRDEFEEIKKKCGFIG